MANAMQELKEQKIWFCYNKVLKDGKLTKVPCSINGGAAGTDKDHSHTWATFDEAVKAAKVRGYSGIEVCHPGGLLLP